MLNCAHLEPQRTGAQSNRQNFARYAIYFTPQPGTALASFGRSWFGRANDGVTLQAFSDAGLSSTGFARLPGLPGRYAGLHARLKAPFALRDDVSDEDLKARLISFASRRKPVETGPLTLARVGRYLALRPVEPKQELDWLAAQCINTFDDFAAPVGVAEWDEHASPHLTDYQRLLLQSFGHPHVLSEYRFAIKLAGPLALSHLERVQQALWPVLEDICADGVTVDGLSLFGDAGGRAPMRLIARYRLGG